MFFREIFGICMLRDKVRLDFGEVTEIWLRNFLHFIRIASTCIVTLIWSQGGAADLC